MKPYKSNQSFNVNKKFKCKSELICIKNNKKNQR